MWNWSPGKGLNLRQLLDFECKAPEVDVVESITNIRKLVSPGISLGALGLKPMKPFDRDEPDRGKIRFREGGEDPARFRLRENGDARQCD